MDVLRRVRVVAVDEHINVRLDVTKHRGQDPPLSLSFLDRDLGSGSAGDSSRVVGRVVVVDMYDGIWQDPTEVIYHLPDSDCLIVTRDQHCRSHGFVLK